MKASSLKFIYILPLVVIFAHDNATAQSRFSVGVSTALDYTTTPEIPRYNSLGYGDQLGFRYGIKAMARLSQRLSFGIALDAYRHKENFDCVYFPTPNNPPQGAYHVIVNNPDYECQFSSKTKISFLEIPLLVQYDLVHREQLAIFIEAGIGYQIITGKNRKLTDLQTNSTSEEQRKANYTWSKKAPRLSVGIAKNLSTRLALAGSLLYKTDSFDFQYNTWGLATTLYYNL